MKANTWRPATRHPKTPGDDGLQQDSGSATLLQASEGERNSVEGLEAPRGLCRSQSGTGPNLSSQRQEWGRGPVKT